PGNALTPTGTVSFFDGLTKIASNVTLGSNGKATFSTSTLTVGTHQISAVYSSVTNFASRFSAPFNQIVSSSSAIGTTTTLASSANPSNLGQSVTFTATVTPTSGSGTPTGTVTFFDGTITLGTGTLSAGKATFMIATLNGGSHSITAFYGGDSTF